MANDSDKMTQLRFRIDNLDCSTCAARMEDAISQLPGVGAVQLDFATAKLRVAVHESSQTDRLTDHIQKLISSIEQDASLLTEETEHSGQTGPSATPVDPLVEKPLSGWRSHLIRHLVLPWKSILRLAIGAVMFIFPWVIDLPDIASKWLWILAWLVLGADVLWTAVRKIARRQWFDEHFLMSLATIGALVLGEYPEAVAVMLFYQTGELLQHMAVDHSRRSIRALLAIRPDTALRLTQNGTEQIHPKDAAVGDHMMIRPGDRVPLDSQIMEGFSTMDTAALTGESQPLAVEAGSEIKAGYVNGDGMLITVVLRTEAESAVSRILRLVEDAVARKAPAERFITRFARIYTPLMIGLAFLLAFLPPLLLDQPVQDWLYRALILIVISCPCALVLSVPLSYFAAIGHASSLGVLIKGGQYLDKLATVKSMAWDKTGTLTDGTFQVRQINAQKPWTQDEVLHLAALTEMGSSHPLARSLIAAWKAISDEPLDMARVNLVQNLPGGGLAATVGSAEILLGNAGLLKDKGVADGRTEHEINAAEPADASVVYLAVDGKLAGRIELVASIRPEAPHTIHELRALGIDRHLLLSGDHPAVVASVARSTGIDYAEGHLLPEDKVAAVDRMLAASAGSASLAYVGDGINDAPVLARADVSVAMGSGSDAALESADIVIQGDDLARLPQTVRLARKTSRIVRQNISLTLGLKLLVVALAIIGLGGIWQAIFADVGVSLLAVFNALRLIREK
jgi:Cd2+/Zn2+-exporting ATPase